MNLLNDDIPALVKKLAIPASVGTLFQTFYNIVDTYFAGKISPEALAALSKSFPIYFIIIATSIGVSVAGTSLIGNSIGENNKKNILFYFSHIIIYGFIIFTLALFLTLDTPSLITISPSFIPETIETFPKFLLPILIFFFSAVSALTT